MTGQPSMPPSFDEVLNREVAHFAFPDFEFSRLTHRSCPTRWVAVCKDRDTTGLYSVAVADLHVLTAVLTLDRAWRAGQAIASKKGFP